MDANNGINNNYNVENNTGTNPVQPSVSEPVLETLDDVPPIIEQSSSVPPTPAPLEPPTPITIAPTQETKSNKKGIVVIIIIAIVVLGVAGYFICTKLLNKSGGSSESKNCINDVQVNSSMVFNGQMGVGVGDTQYIFEKNNDVEFIYKALSFEEIGLNICDTKATTNTDFQVGETTTSKIVKSYELFNKDTNNKITSTSINDLIKELGYHEYGTYTEEAKFINYTGYFSYKVELELSSGKTITAECSNIFPTDRLKDLEPNKKYTFSFEVKEDTFDIIKYVLNGIGNNT